MHTHCMVSNFDIPLKIGRIEWLPNQCHSNGMHQHLIRGTVQNMPSHQQIVTFENGHVLNFAKPQVISVTLSARLQQELQYCKDIEQEHFYPMEEAVCCIFFTI